MTTPQEIREKSFDKARSMFGGYDMATIDEYLDELADDFEELLKENAKLKGKMKVLVDKIEDDKKQLEDYQVNESALNQAILSAQKLSVQIENDARARANSIVTEAEAKSAAMLGSIDERIAQEEARLQAAKLATAKFIDGARELCKKQLQAIDSVTGASGVIKPEQIRIPKEQPAPVSEPSSVDSGNTQVFNFVKDEI